MLILSSIHVLLSDKLDSKQPPGCFSSRKTKRKYAEKIRFILLKKLYKSVCLNYTSQQNLFEDRILNALVFLPLSFDGKFQCLRIPNSGAGNIKLPMSKDVRAQPNSNMFKCLTSTNKIRFDSSR